MRKAIFIKIIHRRDGKNAKKIDVFLSAERPERKNFVIEIPPSSS